MGTQPEINQAFLREISKLKSQVLVLSDLSAMLIAELASASSDAERRIEEILGSEEGAVFAAMEQTNLDHPHMQDVLTDKENQRNKIFYLARTILPRLQARKRH